MLLLLLIYIIVQVSFLDCFTSDFALFSSWPFEVDLGSAHSTITWLFRWASFCIIVTWVVGVAKSLFSLFQIDEICRLRIGLSMKMFRNKKYLLVK
jgi:hypothetical protein